MANGKNWKKGYKEPVLRTGKGCPNGKAKCGCCSNKELVDYKTQKAMAL
jgi:hypothetical protein